MLDFPEALPIGGEEGPARRAGVDPEDFTQPLGGDSPINDGAEGAVEETGIKREAQAEWNGGAGLGAGKRVLHAE